MVLAAGVDGAKQFCFPCFFSACLQFASEVFSSGVVVSRSFRFVLFLVVDVAILTAVALAVVNVTFASGVAILLFLVLSGVGSSSSAAPAICWSRLLANVTEFLVPDDR